MRHQKIIRGLNASPSQIKKKLKHFKLSGYNVGIDGLLVLATQKISPIIKILMDNPSSVEHFISEKACDDIEETINIVVNIVEALDEIGFDASVEIISMDMNRYKTSADANGNVYVDTTLLLGILELHDALENLKEDMTTFNSTLGTHSSVQTDSELLISVTNSDISSPNKFIFKLNKSSTNPPSFSMLRSDFIVMPSSTSVDIPLKNSQSQIIPIQKKESTIRRVQSTSSFEQISKVTDIYGARKVLVQCICDLKGINNYLAIPRKNVSTICSRVEVEDTSGPFHIRRSNASSKSGRSAKHSTHEEFHETDSQHKCCCAECYAKTSRVDMHECEDDQVIICIKGCNKDEGDVQIIIRQCPDCKKGAEQTTEKHPSPIHSETSTVKSIVSKPVMHHTPKSQPPSEKSLHEPHRVKSESHNPTKSQSTIIHNEESKHNLVYVDEEHEDKIESAPPEPTYIQNQAKVSCSRIKLFETTNLCLITGTGQELVISLTVTPKDSRRKHEQLTLKDIFSDNEYLQASDTEESANEYERHSNKAPHRSPSQNGSHKNDHETYYVDDHYIPLGRTKICSSLDFDVTTAESKIRDKGIKNKNNKIVVQLQQFGTDNLLRACRPAKCCRKAVLNEKMKKCLPYAPSIRSLPLDDGDMDVINQSLQMSLQKVKNSTNIKKDFKSKEIYPVMYFFVEDQKEIYQKNWIRQKLNYYINLPNDCYIDHNLDYNILYCGVDSNLSRNTINETVQSCPIQSIKSDENIKVNIANVMKNPLNFIVNKHDFTHTKTGQVEKNKINYLKTTGQKPKSKIPVYLGRNKENCVSNNRTAQFGCELDSTMHFGAYDQYLHEVPSITKKLHGPREIENLSGLESFPKQKYSFRPSIAKYTRKNKRKKKEFYLTRSRSEISIRSLKQITKSKHIFSSTKSTTMSGILSTTDMGQNRSEIILDYFTKMLYKMISKQNKFDLNRQHANVGTRNISLEEIYKKPKTKLTRNKNHLDLRTHPNLKSKISQYCLLQPNQPINNLALRTSTIFIDTKQCQTSNTLLAYVINSVMNTSRKRLILKKTFKTGEANSCDEIENFIISFPSEQSISSNFYNLVDLTPCASRQSIESYQEQSLSQSLLKLKETLERYENVKSEIAGNENTIINPIEYFVYQLCACNSKASKTPSVIQKIFNKTKGLLSSIEKDTSRKSKWSKDTCHNCGCVNSKCGFDAATKNQRPKLLCKYFQQNKSRSTSREPCCIRNKQHCNKLVSASTSLKSLKAPIKKSVSNQHEKGYLEPCKCSKELPDQENTTRESSTQKCDCAKCQSFAEDGTCCCSHCLGCLDKSFHAKPDNNTIATGTEEEIKETNDTSPKVTDHAAPLEKTEEDSTEGKETTEDIPADVEENNFTTSYFFLTPPPHLFRQLNGNPFGHCLLSSLHLGSQEDVSDQ